MNRLSTKVIVLSFMFSGCFFSFFPQNSTAQESSFITGEIANSAPSIVIPSPDNPRIAHLSWPKIVRTAKGNLVVAYSAGVGHNRGGSGPAVSVSRDNGKTFMPPKLLGYYPEDDERYKDAGNFALGTASDGAIILLAMAYSGNENNTIIGWRSEDEGSTWKPVNTDKIAENKTGSIYGEILNVPNVGLVVFGHYRRPSTPSQGIYMSVSKDNGKTWGSPQTVTKHVYVEPAITFSNGRFVGLFRNSASVGNNKGLMKFSV